MTHEVVAKQYTLGAESITRADGTMHKRTITKRIENGLTVAFYNTMRDAEIRSVNENTAFRTTLGSAWFHITEAVNFLSSLIEGTTNEGAAAQRKMAAVKEDIRVAYDQYGVTEAKVAAKANAKSTMELLTTAVKTNCLFHNGGEGRVEVSEADVSRDVSAFVEHLHTVSRGNREMLKQIIADLRDDVSGRIPRSGKIIGRDIHDDNRAVRLSPKLLDKIALKVFELTAEKEVANAFSDVSILPTKEELTAKAQSFAEQLGLENHAEQIQPTIDTIVANVKDGFEATIAHNVAKGGDPEMVADPKGAPLPGAFRVGAVVAHKALSKLGTLVEKRNKLLNLETITSAMLTSIDSKEADLQDKKAAFAEAIYDLKSALISRSAKVDFELEKIGHPFPSTSSGFVPYSERFRSIDDKVARDVLESIRGSTATKGVEKDVIDAFERLTVAGGNYAKAVREFKMDAHKAPLQALVAEKATQVAQLQAGIKALATSLASESGVTESTLFENLGANLDGVYLSGVECSEESVAQGFNTLLHDDKAHIRNQLLTAHMQIEHVVSQEMLLGAVPRTVKNPDTGESESLLDIPGAFRFINLPENIEASKTRAMKDASEGFFYAQVSIFESREELLSEFDEKMKLEMKGDAEDLNTLYRDDVLDTSFRTAIRQFAEELDPDAAFDETSKEREKAIDAFFRSSSRLSTIEETDEDASSVGTEEEIEGILDGLECGDTGSDRSSSVTTPEATDEVLERNGVEIPTMTIDQFLARQDDSEVSVEQLRDELTLRLKPSAKFPVVGDNDSIHSVDSLD